MENEKSKTPLWVKLLLLILVAQNAGLFFLMERSMNEMEQRFDVLEQSVSQTQNIIGESISSIGQEMENFLIQQSSLVNDFHYTVQYAPRGRILLTMSAELKSYTAGSAASFSITVDNGETALIKSTLSNNTLTAETTLPICDVINVGLVITDKQNTQAQVIGEIKNVSDYLTDHLVLIPDVEIKQRGSDLFLSGSLSLLNEFHNMDDLRLDMARMEVTQGNTMLHTFYFSQDNSVPVIDGQDNHILLFEKIKTTPASKEPIIFSVRCRDKGGFEYICRFGESLIDKEGIAAPLESVETNFSLVD